MHRFFLLVLLATPAAWGVTAAPPNPRPEISPYEKNQVKNTVLREVANPIQKCFKEWVKTEAAKDFIVGKIHADWEIQDNGTVKEVHIIHSDLAGINACATRAISLAKFPKPPEAKPYYVAHKFVFKKE